MVKSLTDWFIEQHTIITWLGRHTFLMWFFAITFPYWVSLAVHIVVFNLAGIAWNSPNPLMVMSLIYGTLWMPILNIGFTFVITILPPTWITWIFLLWLASLVSKHNKKELEEQSHSKALPSEQKQTD